MHGHIHGTEPSSAKPLPAKPFLRAIEIGADIDNLEKKVKIVSKKATFQKKRLSRVSKVVKEANKEINYLWAKIQLGDTPPKKLILPRSRRGYPRWPRR